MTGTGSVRVHGERHRHGGHATCYESANAIEKNTYVIDFALDPWRQARGRRLRHRPGYAPGRASTVTQ